MSMSGGKNRLSFLAQIRVRRRTQLVKNAYKSYSVQIIHLFDYIPMIISTNLYIL